MPDSVFARLRVRPRDIDRTKTGQFTVFDLVDACFSFSTKRKHLAAQVLSLVREEPRTFTALLAETGAHKNALYLAVSALLASGFLAQEKRGAPLALSPAFSEALDAYAGFWRTWARSSST